MAHQDRRLLPLRRRRGQVSGAPNSGLTPCIALADTHRDARCAVLCSAVPSAHSYWTGYFTSRPALKGYVRSMSSFLQVVRHFEVFTGADGAASEPFWEAQSVAQHHDAVSGTAKQAVTYDYAQRLAKTSTAAFTFLSTAMAKVVSKDGQADVTFSYCPLANVSDCPATAAGGQVAVVIYNPAGHSLGLKTPLGVQAIVRVPVPNKGYQVFDAAGKLLEQQQTVPVLPTPAQTSGAAQFEAVFAVDVGAIGLTTAFLSSNSSEDGDDGEDGQPMLTTVTDAAVSLENAYYSLSFDSTSGLLTSVTTKADGVSHPFTQDFAWYPRLPGEAGPAERRLHLPPESAVGQPSDHRRQSG